MWQAEHVQQHRHPGSAQNAWSSHQPLDLPYQEAQEEESRQPHTLHTEQQVGRWRIAALLISRQTAQPMPHCRHRRSRG